MNIPTYKLNKLSLNKMSQGTLLAVHLAIFLTLLAFCALLALPVRMLFHMKLEHKDKSQMIPVVEPSPSPDKIDIDYRSLEKCPYEYNSLLQSVHQDYYDENCQRPKPEPVAEVQKEEMKQPQIRIVRKVVTRKLYEPRKKGAKCSNAKGEEQKGPETDEGEDTFPYVSELILKMVLIGLMISAVVERINYYLTKNMETAGAKRTFPKGSFVTTLKSTKCLHSKVNCKEKLDLVNKSFDCKPNLAHCNSRYGSLGARPSSLVRRSSCPTETDIYEDASSTDSPNLRCLRRNTLMFRRR